MDAINALLNPRSVAVIGASADVTKTTGKPVHFLRKHGFRGTIFPVNPRVDSIDGMTCYPDVAALPSAPDVGIVLLGADKAIGAVEALAKCGAKAAIVLASGFAEAGADGAQRQAALASAAGTMRLLGPNTIGVVNISEGVPLSASGALDMDHFPAGPVSIVSQSGGIMGSLLSRAAGRGIGLSKLISTSNEADLELSDFIAHLADDVATRVIALYIETIRSPERFSRAARKAIDNGKTIVAYKIGRSEAGALAAASHTGALAGSGAAYDAFLEAIGVQVAQTYDDLLDIPLALSTGRRLQGKRIAVLTTTGGAGALVSDNLGLRGFDIAPPDAQTAASFAAADFGLPTAFTSNPIDLTLSGARRDVLTGAISRLLGSPSYDGLAIVVGSSGVSAPQMMAEAVGASLDTTGKPVIAYVSPHAPEAAAFLTARGVPTYAAPEAVASAFEGLLRASQPISPVSFGPIATSELPTWLPHGALDEAQAKRLFASFGIPCAKETIVATAEEAEAAARALGGRVVLKVLSADLPHKSDVGGVDVDLDVASIGHRLQAMEATVRARTGVTPKRFLVQELIGGGVEVILGLKRDPLGPVLLVGAGGVATEIFKDTSIRVLSPTQPFDVADAEAMLRRLKSWPLLNGFRGRPGADWRALTQAMVAFARLGRALGDRLLEAEINPIIVRPEGQGMTAVNGVVVLANCP